MMNLLLPEMRLPPLRIRVIYAERAHEWISENGKHGVIFSHSRPRSDESVSNDARDIRAVFMNIRTDEDALRFLQNTQCRWPMKIGADHRGFLSFSDVPKLQQLFRDAAGLNFDEWQRLRRKYSADWIDEMSIEPWFLASASPTSQSAVVKVHENCDYPLLAAVGQLMQIEKLCGLKQLVCEREDCGRLFIQKDKRQKYCSIACSRLVAVRNYRSR